MLQTLLKLCVLIAVVVGAPGALAAVGPFALIRSLLQNNIVGAPVIHRVTMYDFDPDVAERRQQQYFEVRAFYVYYI